MNEKFIEEIKEFIQQDLMKITQVDVAQDYDTHDLQINLQGVISPQNRRTKKEPYQRRFLAVPIKVIFNDPATIVYWTDGTKTVVKCNYPDTFSKETGLAMAIAKKAYGNMSKYNEIFKFWIGEDNDRTAKRTT